MTKTLLKLSLAAALGSPLAAQAVVWDFTFTLNQAQEVAAAAPGVFAPTVPPPGKRVDIPGLSSGFGAGFARYDDVTNTFLFVSVSGTGLSGTITDQHIHIGGPGVSGPVALNMPAPQLNSGGNFSIFGTNIVAMPGPDNRTTLNAAEEAALLAGNAYFNIHTSFDGAGEIRGQMIAVTPVPEPETYALMLGGLALVGWAARRRKAG